MVRYKSNYNKTRIKFLLREIRCKQYEMVEVQRPVDLVSSSEYGVDEHDTRHDHLFSSSSVPDESLKPKRER